MHLCLHPKLSIEIPFSVNAIKIFFPPKRGGLFRILFGIEQPGDYLTRGSEGAQKAQSAGVATQTREAANCQPHVRDTVSYKSC